MCSLSFKPSDGDFLFFLHFFLTAEQACPSTSVKNDQMNIDK